MSSIVTLIIFAVVIVGLLSFSARAKRRQADAQQARAESIGVGTEVMTTSGLYGTVVARHDDDSVQLSIAPGVEVRWALAALREVEGLPEQYRPSTEGRVTLDKRNESDDDGEAPGLAS